MVESPLMGIVCNGCGEPTDRIEPMCAVCMEAFNRFHDLPPEKVLTSAEVLALLEAHGKEKH